jgi:predicted FMN-binding regulatory protein PaiB
MGARAYVSQNRSADDRLGVIAGLARDAEAPAQAMAALMSDGKAPKKIG